MKSQMEIGNDEKKDQLLKTTDEHGTLLFTVKNLFEKIFRKGAGPDNYFLWQKAAELKNLDSSPQAFSEEDCLVHLDAIKTYIYGLDLFLQYLNKPISDEEMKGFNKHKQTYY